MQATAEAHPNIALVKYWGKRNARRNLPAVSSLSVTLDTLRTRMTVAFGAGSEDTLEVNGQASPAMLDRVTRCLDGVAGEDRPAAAVSSESNFPIGAGLASSASAFAALVVAADAAAGKAYDRLTLARLAGAASGSAARSLYGGLVELDAGDEHIDLQQLASPDEWPLNVVVAVTDEAMKPVGSGEGMIRSAASSPFYPSWLEQQEEDLAVARDAIAARDFDALGEIAEHNCLKMHSVMWSSRPPLVYWNSATLACMETVRALRAEGEPVFFTIDAGPQVKAICLAESVGTVAEALGKTPGVVDTLVTGVGNGARLVGS
jgi:diphosphomevalonate decarboxylase